MPSSDPQDTSWKEVSEELNRLHCLMPKYQGQFRSAGRGDIVEDLEWFRYLLMNAEKAAINFVKKASSQVTIILLLGFVPGVWIAALLARARARLDRHRKTLARGRSGLEREAGESHAGAPVNTAGCWLSLLLGAISWVILAALGIWFAYFVEDRTQNTQRTKTSISKAKKKSFFGHPATLTWCHLVYLRERRENGQETDSRTRNGPANNFSGGKETLSSESPMD